MANLNQDKIILVKKMVANAERSIQAARQILEQIDNSKDKVKFSSQDQMIEGIFNGEKMVDLNGKSYPVPANYASKSKLIEGDVLKLIITQDNSFVYKQVGPAERKKVTGVLTEDKKNCFNVLADGKQYQVLSASVSYFKAKPGDQIILTIPKEKVSRWGAIENVVNEEQKPNELDNSGITEAEDNLEELLEEKTKEESIQDEWMPDVEELKKEMGNEYAGNIDNELKD